jgi:hypothetical protein
VLLLRHSVLGIATIRLLSDLDFELLLSFLNSNELFFVLARSTTAALAATVVKAHSSSTTDSQSAEAVGRFDAAVAALQMVGYYTEEEHREKGSPAPFKFKMRVNKKAEGEGKRIGFYNYFHFVLRSAAASYCSSFHSRIITSFQLCDISIMIIG